MRSGWGFAVVFYALPLVAAIAAGAVYLPEPERAPRVVRVRMTPLVREPELEAEVPEPPSPQIQEAVDEEAGGDDVGEVLAKSPLTPAVSPEAVERGSEATRGVVGVPGVAKPARVRKPNPCREAHPNVRSGGDGVVEIDRSLVDEYTRNLQAFMSLGISHSYDKNGLDGWYIGGFSCRSPVYKAGFRPGDVLLEVNGKRTRSWVGVFMLYQKLKNRGEFDVSLVRKGKPMQLRFRVVEA